MNWKITTLIENHQDEEEKYICEHGLSLLIEKEGCKMLMDTGKSGLFYENALKMGEKLDDLDFIVLSHGHYDHVGGLMRLLGESGRQKRLYVGQGFFEEKYCKNREGELYYNGIQFCKEDLEKYHLQIEEITEDFTELASGIWLHRNFEHSIPYEHWNHRFFLKGEKDYILDKFCDEVALVLDTDKGLVVVVGCSHPGIVNMLTTIAKRTGRPIRGVIGGTHLMDADEERLLQTMEDFQALGMEFIGVSHCTGEQNIEKINEKFGSQFIFNRTGNVILL